jgi:hypothetical protein
VYPQTKWNTAPAVTPAPNPLLRKPTRHSGPKGRLRFALGCLGLIVLWAGIGVVAYMHLPDPRNDEPWLRPGFAAVVGMIGAIGASGIISMVFGEGRGKTSLKPLLERCRTDGPTEDGEFVIATGTVRADRPLTSPLGGVSCAMYDYRMFRRTGKGKHSKDEPIYWGWAAQPISIDSASRRYPIAGVPLPAGEPTRLTGDAVLHRARGYIRATGWETVEYELLGTLDTAFQRLGDDSSVGTRRDFALNRDTPPEVSTLLLEENVLPIGVKASVFGTWSASAGAIVAPPSPFPGSRTIVAQGGPENLNGQPGVPRSATANFFGSIVAMAMAYGIYWFGKVFLPNMQ